jgi:hypothetical protein
MAFAIANNWQYYADTGSDTRQSSVQQNNTGTSYINSTAFDYFIDTAAANATINFNSVRRHWGIRIYVGTAFAADAVTFIWEYQTGSTTWATLRVKNHNALLSTGSQDIEYTPPSDWWCQREKGWGIRCRIVSVTNITEGGANSTNRVTFNHKAIRATGTETTITGAVTLNNANTYEILPATTSAASLVPIQMSVGLVRDVAKVDVVLAGTSAGAGDTVVLTGSDLDGNALTETIDVSGGDGTYTSTLAYADITLVACNGFADGTTQVLQKKLGVIEQVTEYVYILNTFLEVGDGTTAASLTLKHITLYFLRGAFWHCRTGSTFTTGELMGSGTAGEDYSRGINIYEGTYGAGSLGIGADIRSLMNTGTVNLQDVMMRFFGGGTSESVFRPLTGGVLNIRSSSLRNDFSGSREIYKSGGEVNFKNARCDLSVQQSSGVLTIDGFVGNRINAELTTVSFTADNAKFRVANQVWFYTSVPAGVGTYLDCPGLTTAGFSIGWNGQGNGVEKLRIMYRLNLFVTDEAGTPIQGATVKITDGVGAVTTLTTDANGNIAETNLIAYSGSYVALAPAITWVDKRAYTFEIKKSGYQPVKILKTITERIDETVVLERNFIQIDQEGIIK